MRPSTSSAGPHDTHLTIWVKILILMFILMIVGCRPTDTSLEVSSAINLGDTYTNGTLYFHNSAADGVNWGDNGFRLTLGLYYQNYYVNINKHADGIVAIRGIENTTGDANRDNSLEYEKMIFRDFAGVPPKDVSTPPTLVKLTYSETQAMFLEGADLRYFLKVYLSQATPEQKSYMDSYKNLASVESHQSFHTTLATFLATLPQG